MDALCKRFNIDNSARTFHGALLDAQLLAEVYLELLGGKELTLQFSSNNSKNEEKLMDSTTKIRNYREPRIFDINDDLEEQHKKFLNEEIKNAIWLS